MFFNGMKTNILHVKIYMMQLNQFLRKIYRFKYLYQKRRKVSKILLSILGNKKNYKKESKSKASRRKEAKISEIKKRKIREKSKK